MSDQCHDPLDQLNGGWNESHQKHIKIDLRWSNVSWFTHDKSSQETEYYHDIRLIRCSTRSSPSHCPLLHFSCPSGHVRVPVSIVQQHTTSHIHITSRNTSVCFKVIFVQIVRKPASHWNQHLSSRKFNNEIKVWSTAYMLPNQEKCNHLIVSRYNYMWLNFSCIFAHHRHYYLSSIRLKGRRRREPNSNQTWNMTSAYVAMQTHNIILRSQCYAYGILLARRNCHRSRLSRRKKR